MTETQLKAVDDFLETHATPTTITITLSDGTDLQVKISPGALIETEALTFGGGSEWPWQ
jgi:hypothetical protein